MLDRPHITAITAEDDPRIAGYRSIRERDLIGREGHFIAEGDVVLRVLLAQQRYKPLSLLLDAKRLNTLEELLQRVPEGTPVYTASTEILSAIAGFHLHRGILALGECATPLAPQALLGNISPDAPLVVLCGIANHDNLGGIFRNAAALGAGGILLDSQCCNPFYRKALRVSVGAVLRVPFATLAPEEDLLSVLESAGYTPLALTPKGSVELHNLKPQPRTALMLGTEGAGLSEGIMQRALTVSIPMDNNFDSLNVATTSGIVLHHLRKPV